MPRYPRRHRQPRKGKTPNPAFKNGLSDAALISTVEAVAFREVGCSILPAFGIKPISLLGTKTAPKEGDD